MHFLNNFKRFKYILLSFCVIAFTFLIFSFQHISYQEKIKPLEANKLSVVSTSLNNNFALSTPILCDYEINTNINEILQNCINLINPKEFYLLIEIDISGHFKLDDIVFYTQDDEIVDDAKIVSFSKIPYTLLENYSNNCSDYCFPSRLFFQFRLFNNKQIRGFKLTGFRFKDKLRPSSLTNYDPSKLDVKVVKSDEKIYDYDTLREKINNPNQNNIWLNERISTPTSSNQGINSVDLRGVDVDINFFRLDNRIEKITFNLQNHSLSLEECISNLNKDLIGTLDENEVCNYLVYQRNLANQFGNASFILDLNKLNTTTNITPTLEITLTSEQFFEKLLFSYKNISFNTLSTDILNKQQWMIFALVHLSPFNKVLETITLKFHDLTEDFLVDFFSIPKIKDIEILDLSNNNISLSSKTATLFEKFKIKKLYLNDNILEDSFIFNNLIDSLETLNVRNTNWSQVKNIDLWRNIPNIKELFLAGTKVDELSLDEFVALLPNPQNIISFEANFLDIDNLNIEKINNSFPSIERLNVPLTHYLIDDLAQFIMNTQNFAGKIGLPPNGTDFENSSAYEIFQAANDLKDKIVDFNNQTISLYYDLYIGSLFRKYLKGIDFFNNNYVKDNLQSTIDETIHTYKTLFESANMDSDASTSFSKQHENVLNSFENAAFVIESKITGQFLSNYINDNMKIVKEYRLNNAPTNDDTSFIIAISILIVTMFLTIFCIVLIVWFRF